MKGDFVERTYAAQSALQMFPPKVWGALLADRDFCVTYGLSTEAHTAFGGNASFQRSVLFKAIRSALSSKEPTPLQDLAGEQWVIAIQTDLEAGLVLVKGEMRLRVESLFALSPDAEFRLRQFEIASTGVNLPTEAKASWRRVIGEHSLGDDEVAELIDDLADTPVRCASRILSDMRGGNLDVQRLVPRSRRYYERLVGRSDLSCLSDYANNEANRLAAQQIEWRPKEGFLWALLLSSHSSNVAAIPTSQLDDQNLLAAYSLISDIGDRISQVGAFELGVTLVAQYPGIEPYLVTIAKKLRDDDPSSKTGQFALLSALFILVDSELSRTRLFADCQPYYRRLASLAQASLLERCAVTSQIEWGELIDWAFDRGGAPFYMQTLVDLRTEPRWLPDFASAELVKADLVGRMLLGADRPGVTPTAAVKALVSGDNSLLACVPTRHIFLPGPLEGAISAPLVMPADMAKEIDLQLRSPELGPGSFIALVNAALLFNIEVSHTELAAQGLRAANHRLKNATNPSELLVILRGLAHVAAAARSTDLADEIALLVRRCRIDELLDLVDTFPIYMIAAASRSDLGDWCEFVGKWLTELALACSDIDEAEALHRNLTMLQRSEPSLWTTVGSVDAMLRAQLKR